MQFQWTAQCEDAFAILKQALIQAPVLAVPDFAKQFVIETDASDDGMGAVLMQDNHPISFLSKPLCDKNKGLSTYKKECMAILMAVERWSPYLQSQEFLTEQKASTKLQQKAPLKLMDLSFKIQYKKGSTNAAADALSRCQHVSTDHVLSISSCTPSWLGNLQDSYTKDPDTTKLLAESAITTNNDAGFSLQQGIIRYKGHIWIGNNKLAQNHILQALHVSGIGGHSGIQVTYQRVKSLFAWPKMKQDVTHFVQSCATCQQAKAEHVKLPGLLQPLAMPDRAWKVVNLDFIEGLPIMLGRWSALILLKDCPSLKERTPSWSSLTNFQSMPISYHWHTIDAH